MALYRQDWSAGNSLFSSGVALANPYNYQRSVDGADPLYPEMFRSQSVKIVGGMLDLDTADVGADYQVIGAWLKTFPTPLVLDLGGYVKVKNWPSVQSLADVAGGYVPIISILDGGLIIELSYDVFSGTLFFAGSGFFPATFSFNSAWTPIAGTGYEFEIRWTPVGGGNYDVECFVNGVLIYTEPAFALLLGGVGNYEIMELMAGYNGLLGPNEFVEVGDLAGSSPPLPSVPPSGTSAVNFWANAGSYGGFPPHRSLIMSPTVGTNYSRGKAVTMVYGTVLTNYPATNLTDDSMQTALRVSEYQIDLYIDLSVTRLPAGVAILNHNFDEGLVVQVFIGDDSGFGSGSYQQVGVAAAQPNMWVDLRTFLVAGGRYVRISTPAGILNSVPITMGEVVVPSMYELADIEPGLQRGVTFWVHREFTEEVLPYKMASGAFTRRLELGLEMGSAARTVIETVFDDAGMNGYRVLVIPDSRKNDAYFVDWPSRRAIGFPGPSSRVTKTRLLLLEETPGVI